MLFRPLRPWRILGVRLPLTPGIIPSKRFELAEKMGDMVGSHLLTSEDVGRALEKASFRRELKGAVAEKLGHFLDRELGPVESLDPENYRGRFAELANLLRWKAVKVVFDYLESPVFEREFRAYLRRRGDELLTRDLESYLTPERYEALRVHLDGRISALSALGKRGSGRLGFRRCQGRTVARLRPHPAGNPPGRSGRGDPDPTGKRDSAPAGKIRRHALRPGIPRASGEKGREGIEGFLDSLGGLAGLLSGFINLEKIYARIPEFLDKAGDEIARWLREEKTQKQVALMLRERVDGLLDRSLGTFFEKVPYEKVAGVRRFLRTKATDLVRSRRAAESAMALVEHGVERLKDRSFASLLNQALPKDGLERGRERLADRLLGALRAPGNREALEQVLAEKMDQWLFRQPLGKLSARIPADVREELEEGVYQQLAEVLKREVPPLVETLNVSRMVEEKVNSLDILKVEGLLMGIMQEQFKYINLFGALLGF